eukprot:53481_1
MSQDDEMSTLQLETYKRLIDMEFPEKISLAAAKKFKGNINERLNKCIALINRSTKNQSTNVESEYQTNINDDDKHETVIDPNYFASVTDKAKSVIIDEKYNTDDYIAETLINYQVDRRKAIWNSPNKDDEIIKCICSLETEYTEDMKHTEQSIGTGTVIHIDEQNMCYILTAAHNFYQTLRKCSICQKTTIKAICGFCPHAQKTEESKPFKLIKAEQIFFTRRCIVQETIDPKTKIKCSFGDPITVIQVHPDDCYCRELLYRLYKLPTQGYDIAIMKFKCPDEDVHMYSSICSKIQLKCDPGFCFAGNKLQLFIYGYPDDKKANDGRYRMYGMASSMNGNKFKIKTSKSKKRYIVNTEIDTTGGQSGACIWSYDGKDKNKYIIYAIHTAGRLANQHSEGANYGTFLDDDHINWIKELKENDAQTKLQLMQSRQKQEEKISIDFFLQNNEKIRMLTEELQMFKEKEETKQKQDEWDQSSIRNHQLQIRNNIITLKCADECDTIFLKKIVTKGTYQWKFRIHEHRENKPIFFGIWKSECGSKIPDKGYYNGYIGEKAGDSYVFDGGDAKCNIIDSDEWKPKNSYGKSVKKGHIVIMRIDFDSIPCSLSFIIDDESYNEPAFIIKNCGYRAAISLFEKGDSVELLFQ